MPVAQIGMDPRRHMAQAQTPQVYMTSSGLALDQTGQNQDNTNSAHKMAATISDGAAPAPTASVAVTSERPKISEYEAALLKMIAHLESKVKRQRRVYKLILGECLALKRRLRMVERMVHRAHHRSQRRAQLMDWCKLPQTHDAEDDDADDTEDGDGDGDGDDEGTEEQIEDHQTGTVP